MHAFNKYVPVGLLPEIDIIQISGSKRWVLFPPSDIDSLYPTRIPYEESTVFSEVNLGNPDFLRHER